MTTYKSKVGPGLIIPPAIIVGGTGILMAYEKVWPGLIVILLVVAFISHMISTTYYQINKGTLRVRCGFFFDKSIDIDAIKDIKETRSPISSPATSLDRIIISYNKFDTVLISPRDKEGFVNHLTNINLNIKVTLKYSGQQRIMTS